MKQLVRNSVFAVTIVTSAILKGQSFPEARLLPKTQLTFFNTLAISDASNEPLLPLRQTVEDSRTHVIFDLSAGWNLSRKDGEISTFHLDARTAPKKSEMRTVAALSFNPFPFSTFSGALFYLSLTPRSTALACAQQTTVKPERALSSASIGDLQFSRGLDEHGHICTEARNMTYTAMRRKSCIRLDLVVNTFCGGEVSGARDMTEGELASVFQRLQDILATIRFH